MESVPGSKREWSSALHQGSLNNEDVAKRARLDNIGDYQSSYGQQLLSNAFNELDNYSGNPSDSAVHHLNSFSINNDSDLFHKGQEFINYENGDLMHDDERSDPVIYNVEICFGMIADVRVRFVNEQQQLRVAALLRNSSPFCICTLSFAKGRCNLVLNDHESTGTIATLSNRDFDQLGKLGQKFNLRFDGIFSKELLVTNSASLLASIGINVYGSCTGSEQLADDFLAACYFLQDPVWRLETTEYKNPQSFEPADLGGAVECLAMSTGEKLALITSSLESSKYIRSDGFDFGGMLDDFARHEYLSQADVDTSIHTLLESHQREGLDFILKRESESALAERSLWRLDGLEDGVSIFRHLITGATSTERRETVGGILADEMGLGKSLTMLSAIVASSKDAWHYARSETIFAADSSQSKIAARSTLLVVPSAMLIDNWIKEIEKHIRPSHLSYYIYHGHRRKIQWANLIQYDVVLTTYGTVAAELRRPQQPLFQVSWYRLVLDEAHIIRNCSTNKFDAVRSLQSMIRWCVTGTPIQNSLDDLGSLVRFLRTPILEEAAQFQRHIISKVQPKNGTSDFENLHTLLGSICLRRNKNVLPMSESTEDICQIEFTNEEQHEYDRIGKLCLKALDMAVSGHTTGKKDATVIEAILKLRLFCNNGVTNRIAWTRSALQNSDEAFALLQQTNSAVCYYCHDEIMDLGTFDDPDSAKMTRCSKLVCNDCLDKYGREHKNGICPICRLQHNELAPLVPSTSLPLTYPDKVYDSSVRANKYSTKLQKLCQNIIAHQKSEKSIVFSFWKITLDLVCQIFQEREIRYLRLDGDVAYGKRKEIISKFQESEGAIVLLMSLSIGAVGLNNLTVASQIHILEPQWNPAVEDQAIGRVVRLGQERPVRVFRYVVKNSMELSVRDRQHQKLRLFRDGFNNNTSENAYQMMRLIRHLIHPEDAHNE